MGCDSIALLPCLFHSASLDLVSSTPIDLASLVILLDAASAVMPIVVRGVFCFSAARVSCWILANQRFTLTVSRLALGVSLTETVASRVGIPHD